MKLTARSSIQLAATLVFLGSFGGCGSDDDSDKPKAGALGSACDAADAGSCASGLECNERDDGFFCTYPAGALCSPDNDALVNGGCAGSAECKVAEDDAEGARCLTQHGGACDPDEAFCDTGLTCARVNDDDYRCFAPVAFRGQVSNSVTGDAIGDAQVIAIDEEGVAVSDVAITDDNGNYELEVPVARNEDGSPIDTNFTLRAAAQQYQPFPSGIRVALPINVSEATEDESRYVVESTLTDITLIPLDAGDLYWISGRVVALADGDSEVGGVLVVAKGDSYAVSAVTDRSGRFTIFNVPEGEHRISGYAADIQIESETVSVAGDVLEGVELHELGEDTTTVSGNIQIVNAPGGARTSVILVVEDTFDPNAARGEVPRGLRAPRTGKPDVTGDFVIENVPAGRYVVLAAYENDALVRDPDTNIGGTQFVTLEVNAGESDITLSDSFKVTEALEVLGPGVDTPEAVEAKPTLRWADDSSEDWYEVRVFDAFGDEVWSDLMVPSVSGSSEVTLAYDGPLEPGMYYQFRVLSWRQPGNGDAAPISATEDLRGVFYLPAR